MITWKTISLEDREIIDSFTKNRFDTCDLNFSNLFLWSKGDNLEYKVHQDCLMIRGESLGKKFAYSPVSKDDNPLNLKICFEEFLSEGIPIICIPEKYKLLLENQFDFLEYRDSFDYVYRREDLAFLRGRRFSKKKNRINNFTKLYQFKYEQIDSSNIPAVIEFQNKWQREREGDKEENLHSEHLGILSLFENFSSLDLKGAILKVDGKIIAYSLGEILNSDMGVIHIEKADSSYIGSYQVINYLFAQNEFEDVTYLNREDDAGDEGIRQAKESYNPAFLLKKYTVTNNLEK
jgi:hypothetical protein